MTETYCDSSKITTCIHVDCGIDLTNLEMKNNQVFCNQCQRLFLNEHFTLNNYSEAGELNLSLFNRAFTSKVNLDRANSYRKYFEKYTLLKIEKQ